MLKIRLQRTGRKNAPSFRIVVVERARSPKAGNFLEQVGTYNPKTKTKNLNADRIKYWLSVGAQLSATMHNMLVSAGIIEGKKINVLPSYKPPAAPEAKPSSAPPSREATDGQSEAVEDKEKVPAPELKDDTKAAQETVVSAARDE